MNIIYWAPEEKSVGCQNPAPIHSSRGLWEHCLRIECVNFLQLQLILWWFTQGFWTRNWKGKFEHSSKYRHVLARTSYYYLKVAQIVILSCFRTVSNPILVKNVTFKWLQLMCDRRTKGWTDRRMDTPSYRDARTHLKMSHWPIST